MGSNTSDAELYGGGGGGGGGVQMDNSTEEYRLPCTDNPALVNHIPYYRKFPVESNSHYRISVLCAVHEIWQWKHSTVVWVNGIA